MDPVFVFLLAFFTFCLYLHGVVFECLFDQENWDRNSFVCEEEMYNGPVSLV